MAEERGYLHDRSGELKECNHQAAARKQYIIKL